MASQNVDPSRVNNSSARKQRDKSDTLPGGLHSVTLRSVEITTILDIVILNSSSVF